MLENKKFNLQYAYLSVAQPDSALASGARGRGFKSRHLDGIHLLTFPLEWDLSKTFFVKI